MTLAWASLETGRISDRHQLSADAITDAAAKFRQARFSAEVSAGRDATYTAPRATHEQRWSPQLSNGTAIA
jgi:hypothetical protein